MGHPFGSNSLLTNSWQHPCKPKSGLHGPPVLQSLRRKDPHLRTPRRCGAPYTMFSAMFQRTTMLTSFFGTTITFTTCFPSIAALTFSSARASSRRRSSVVSIGMVRRPRTLPLI